MCFMVWSMIQRTPLKLGCRAVTKEVSEIPRVLQKESLFRAWSTTGQRSSGRFNTDKALLWNKVKLEGSVSLERGLHLSETRSKSAHSVAELSGLGWIMMEYYLLIFADILNVTPAGECMGVVTDIVVRWTCCIFSQTWLPQALCGFESLTQANFLDAFVGFCLFSNKIIFQELGFRIFKIKSK